MRQQERERERERERDIEGSGSFVTEWLMECSANGFLFSFFFHSVRLFAARVAGFLLFFFLVWLVFRYSKFLEIL